MSIITLTTDFGEGSGYVAQMKGVALSINPEATLVDISHRISAQDVEAGALILDDCCWRFPAGSIHLAVVDPGVGTERAIVALDAGGHSFVAPNNGLLTRIARRHTPTALVQLTTRSFWLEPVSSTFHGRDIMAPVAAHLSLGVSLTKLGQPTAPLRQLDFAEPRVFPERILGRVLAVDSFGNAITNIDRTTLPSEVSAERIVVQCADTEVGGVVSCYAEQESGAAVALFGSSDRIELAVVNGNAAAQLGIQVGDDVVVRWSAAAGGLH